MGTKKFKKQPNKLTWSLGNKRRSGTLSAYGMNATSAKHKILRGTNPSPRCEMCGSIDATWRNNLVCLCTDCWTDLRHQIGI